MFVLATALAAGAFRDYNNLEDILEARPEPNMEYAIFEWKQEILETYFYQTMNSKGATGKCLTAAAFNRSLGEWSVRAGFEREIKVHDIRREALIKADGM
jgi:hypothetical protein